MRVTVFLLIIASLIGYDFPIAAGITFSDIALLPLLVITLFKVMIKRDWKIDRFAKLTFFYFSFMIASSLLNVTITDTSTINYLRIYFDGLLVYISLYNAIKTESDFKKFIFLGAIYIAYYTFQAKNLMSISNDAVIADINEFAKEFSYGRNNVGFTGLLLIMFSLFLYQIKIINLPLTLFLLAINIVVLILSVSRMSIYGATIFGFLYLYINRSRIKFLHIVTFLLLVSCLYAIVSYFLTFISGDMLEAGMELIKNKTDEAQGDFYHIRIELCNLIPISEFYNDANFIQILFGDGYFLGHSFIAHTLINTGIFGFLFFLYAHIYIMNNFIKRGVVGKYVTIFVVIMLFNDFITNARFIIQVNTILYSCMCAYAVRYLLFSKNKILTNRPRLNMSV